MITALPKSIGELKKTLLAINKVIDNHDNKYEKAKDYREIGKLWNNNKRLILDYFSLTPYTSQQCTFAAHLYGLYGIDVYKSICAVFPKGLGKQIASWDDFMLSQIARLSSIFHGQCYHASYYTGYTFNRDTFINDIESICDDDLYVEMMCSIARSLLFQDSTEASSSDFTYSQHKYVIDYEFLQKRKNTIQKSVSGMQRYVNLVEYLFPYDYMGAFIAWGDFYYFFEEVYENNPPTSTTFTGKLYNVFFTDNTQEGKTAHQEFADKQKKIKSYIQKYGWQYLHHAFEINTSADWCLKWIYDNLTPADQIKADAAKHKYITSKAAALSKHKKQFEANDEELKILSEALCNDPQSAISVWKSYLLRLEQKKRISKESRKKHFDTILYHAANEAKWSKNCDLIILPMIKDIRFPVIKLYQYILEDEWMLSYIFRYCQLIAVPTELAGILLLLNRTETLKKCICILKENTLLSVSIDYFVSSIQRSIRMDDLLQKAEGFYETYQEALNNDSSINPEIYAFDTQQFFCPRIENQFIKVDSLPEVIKQLRIFIDYCNKTLGEIE